MRNQTIIITWIAAIIGVFDSAYLAYVKFAQSSIYCTPGLGDCVSVNSSQWSVIWGIPVAIFGIATYLAVIGLLLLAQKIHFMRSYAIYFIFGIGLFGVLYSLYLTYIEFFVLHAVCQWCILSAICITTIFIATIIRLKEYQFQPNK
ncbi:MAG: vitamin K epoxide reductase [Anaerolinea sp.]|nr:vitamin K epoxide reductase [Anaerolinea sp.]